jgi:hypothetical protein
LSWSINKLLDLLWADYINFNPKVLEIYNLIKKYEPNIVNDHIAFRTINLENISINYIKNIFLDKGYKEIKSYYFKEKKLNAIHLEFKDYPKIFLSELIIEEFPKDFKIIFNNLLKKLNLKKVQDKTLMLGAPWEKEYQTYMNLNKHSEYASWFYANGFRPNHFTISVNHLENLNSLEKLNSYLISQQIKLNESNGLIKGSSRLFLEQSSTVADLIKVKFNDTTKEIPSCYYEFAMRYKNENAELFEGFLESSADKIFESTNLS